MKANMISAAIALAWFGTGLASAASPAADPVHGKQVFAKCAACHSVGQNARRGIGPELNGVIGRKAGTAPGYRYSAAMRRSGLTWDAETLSRFLQSPSKVVPGTRMAFPGLSKPEDRADVIAYLAQYAADGTNK